MAVTVRTVTHHHATCALPRRRNSTPTTTPTRSTRRGRAPSPSSGHHLTTTTSRSLPNAPPPSDTLDGVLSDLEAHPRLLTAPLLASLLSTIPRHHSPRGRLARLRRLIPVSLLRRYGDLAVRLLHLHACLGLAAYAHYLFDHLLPPRAREDTVPWNCLVAGYARLGRHYDALALYLQMDEDGVPRDRVTFAYALEACAGAGSVDLGMAVHRDVVRAGLASDVLLCQALLDMYAQCGEIHKARRVFDAMPVKDTASWNVMLAGCLRQEGLWSHSMDIWRRMFREGKHTTPGPAALSAMLQLLTSSSSHSDDDYSKWGLEIHAWVIRHGLHTEPSVANALIGMYSEKNELDHALSVFESIPARDHLSWNAIISAHRNDYGVLMMFLRMVDSGVQPGEVTFATVLSACNNLGLVEAGMRLFSEMENVYRVQPTMEHCACIVNMLGKAGMVHDAYEFLSKRTRSLNSEPPVLRDLLRACAVHGNIKIGEIVAEKLFDLEPDNEQNFVLLMRIYQRAGRLEDMDRVKKMMRDRGF